MPEGTGRRLRLWPRSGIMASEAGRSVVLGSFALAATSLGLAVALLGAGTAFVVNSGRLGSETAGHFAVGVAGGVLAVGLAFALLPLLARFSRLGEKISLLELCDPGTPLLRELREEAGGTYNHSIMAGALAEAAARAIGANALLTRVGAYYHDIGKLARPRFFAENQLGLRNPHDGADPAQSAMVITAHVREGVEMAQRAGLPQPVIDIIAEHHGTSLVTYFYRRASADGAVPDESRFRYEGARPHTREAALVMLADAAEATVRGLSDPGPVQIEAAVRRSMRSKLADGQFSESGMSESDIEVAVLACAKMLSGLRHSRVAYPEDAEGDDDAGDSQLQP